MALHEVCRLHDLPVGAVRKATFDDVDLAVFNVGGELLAMEDRCSHDDGDLADGEVDQQRCTVECPRHGSLFDLKTGTPLTLPAYEPVETFAVLVEDGVIKVDVE